MRSPASTDHIAHELEGLRPELNNEDECEEVRDVDEPAFEDDTHNGHE